MTTTQKTTDVTAPRRSHWWWTVPGCLAMVLLNAAVSYGIVRLNAPVTARDYNHTKPEIGRAHV